MHTKSYGLDLLRIISSLLVFIPHIVISLSKDPALVKNSFIISILDNHSYGLFFHVLGENGLNISFTSFYE